MPERAERSRWLRVAVLVVVLAGLVLAVLMFGGVLGGAGHVPPKHGSAATPEGGR